MIRITPLLLTAALLAASCAPGIAPPPTVVPEGDDRFLVDPRVGYPAPIPEPVATRFDAAWGWVMAGNETEAQRLFADIQKRAPDFPPLLLAQAALHIRGGRFDDARRLIELAQNQVPDYTAARVYEAEIAVREGNTRVAYELYAAIAAAPGAPELASERLAGLRAALYDDLIRAAASKSESESIALLREALAIQETVDARILLARALVEQRSFNEARRELDPILDTAATQPAVQEILAEIDVGNGRYEEAIARYDRLARRTGDPRHQQRLEAIKQEWSAANMPRHYREALDSNALTREQLATLLYWTVPSIRFAQSLGTPPIAVDIEDLASREEVIRALAIGLYEVDPVTRRVSPYRTVTAAQLANYLSRLLQRRGAPCAHGAAGGVLAACGVSDPLSSVPAQEVVSGRLAAELLTQVAKVLR